MAHAILAIALLGVCAEASADAEGVRQNPISRVVELMRRMQKKVELDGKNEKDLFEKYECWYKTVVTKKENDILVSSDRVSSLNGYIADIEAGSIDFTSEAGDLGKEVKTLRADIDSMKSNRDREHEEYSAAKDEMEKSVAALESAVDVLSTATADMKGSALLVMGNDLQRTLSIGRSFVKKSDSQLLNKFLSGSTPEGDVFGNIAKDNKHMQKYKAKSGKIVEILADMLETFQDNLADAIKLEEEKSGTHDTLLALKESQLSGAESASTSAEKETGQRNINKQEAQAEANRLSDQISRDTGFVSQAKESYAMKTSEFKERQRLRTGEVAAISEAAAVLSSDDARDLASKSMDSQGYLFIQDETAICMQNRADSARKVLKRVGFKHSNMRIAMLAVNLHYGGKREGVLTRGHFDAVIDSVDSMISDLAAEAEEDVKTKEKCENDRRKNSRLAKVTSQQIDDITALIARKNAAIAERNGKIARANKNIAAMNEQIRVAQEQRDEENTEYEAKKADDVAAKSLVDKSMTVLKKFYDDEGLALVQTQKGPVADEINAGAAGDAPPPPPATFAAPYGGAKAEANGIQAIMQMIMDDIDKDIRDAGRIEDVSVSDFNTFKSDTESVINDVQEQVVAWETEIGDLQEEITTSKSNRGDKKTLLDNTMGFLRLIAPECDFMMENFELRKENRQTENDGLAEAKASLNGGTFDFIQEAKGHRSGFKAC